MWLLPVRDFLELGPRAPLGHQALQVTKQLVEWQSGMLVVFVSHQWVSFRHPDPRGLQLRELWEAMQLMLSGQLEVCYDLESEFILKKSACIGAKDLGRLSDAYLWYDYWSIPQVSLAPAGCREAVARQLWASVMAISDFVARAQLFLALCPEVGHEDTGEICSCNTWRQRGWCRFEQMCSSLRLPAPAVEDTVLLKSARNVCLISSLRWLSSPVGEGQFTVGSDRGKLRTVLQALLERYVAGHAGQGQVPLHGRLLPQDHEWPGAGAEPRGVRGGGAACLPEALRLPDAPGSGGGGPGPPALCSHGRTAKAPCGQRGRRGGSGRSSDGGHTERRRAQGHDRPHAGLHLRADGGGEVPLEAPRGPDAGDGFGRPNLALRGRRGHHEPRLFRARRDSGALPGQRHGHGAGAARPAAAHDRLRLGHEPPAAGALLKRGASTAWCTLLGGPLHMVALFGHGGPDFVELLAKHGADPNAVLLPDSPAERLVLMALQLAPPLGSSELWRLLPELNGATPLLVAAMRGHGEICRSLLLHLADHRCRNARGHSALDLAMAQGTMDLLRDWQPDSVLLFEDDFSFSL